MARRERGARQRAKAGQALQPADAPTPTGNPSTKPSDNTYDLAVIGSGGAAFAAAIAARRKGKRVVMIERGTTGGTCVNTGCVPSKALLAAADARHVALTADRFPGIGANADKVAFDQLVAGKDALVAGVRTDKYVDLAAEYGWEILPGEARFVPGPALEVTRASLAVGAPTETVEVDQPAA